MNNSSILSDIRSITTFCIVYIVHIRLIARIRLHQLRCKQRLQKIALFRTTYSSGALDSLLDVSSSDSCSRATFLVLCVREVVIDLRCDDGFGFAGLSDS